MQRLFHPNGHRNRRRRDIHSEEEPEENFMSKQGQTELNSALPFVTNWI